MDIKKISFKGEELVDCLLSVSTQHFAILDQNGRFHEANEAFCRLTGRKILSLKKHTLFDLIPEEDVPVVRGALDAPGSAPFCELEFHIRSADGKKTPVLANLCLHDTEEGTFICLFCKEKPIDPERLELFNLQAESLASSSNAVVITDAAGEIVWANRAFSKVTGYSFDEAVGRQPGEVLKSGKHPKSFYADMWETIRRGETWQGEIFNRRKNGELYPEEMTITPLFNEQGRITHYIAIKQDISEKKTLQEMFLRAQRLESVGTLASGVAHDLNNVLSPIVMSADLLMVQSTDPHTREMLLMIKDSAKRGADIIRQLLTFVRGEDEELVELQVRHLLKDLVKVFRETFPRYIQIEDRIASDIRPVKGNATNLTQVFTNLMINARDAMPAGGLLQLRVENACLNEKQAAEIPEGRAGDFVRISVTDEGTGIAEEDMNAIFQSFYTTKEKGQGTGLGLPTALSIVRKHQGMFRVSSELGRGTCFDVYIPVFDGESSLNVKTPEEDIPYGTGEKILVIDDEKSIGYMLKGTLKSLNYEVYTTTGGKEGIDWYKENREECDLILLDMMMPEMDGVDVYKALQAVDPDAKILIMSGMVSDDKLKQTGADLNKSFISKPFAIADLARKVNQLISG